MEKNNKSLIVVLIIIIVLLLGIMGFMYVKFNSDSNNKENVVTDNNKKDSNENDNNVTNDVTKKDVDEKDNHLDTKLVEKFVGKYSYKGEYVDKDINSSDDNSSAEKTSYESLSLFSDGTANASAGNVRAGGYSASGKWYISFDELIIVNDTCKAYEISNDGEIVYGNCQPIWHYKYEIVNDEISIKSSNNSITSINLIKEK